MKEIKKTGGSIADVVSAMRPAQWTKNTVVFAALFFGFWDKHVSLPLVPSILRVCFAAALFCLVSSGIYLINDIRDLAADRMHPIKKNRPIASGKVSVINAAFLAIVLIAAGLVGSWFLKAIVFTEIIAGYVLLQVVYSYGLKHVALGHHGDRRWICFKGYSRRRRPSQDRADFPVASSLRVPPGPFPRAVQEKAREDTARGCRRRTQGQSRGL